MIWLGAVLLIIGLFMCSQNTATVIGAPLATIGAALMLVWLLGGAALAHDPVTGESNWIEKNGYRGTDNIGCCGPNDCERLSPEEIEPRRGGFFLKRFNELVPFSEATPSEDSFSWRCHKSYSRSERRCFFFRYGAS